MFHSRTTAYMCISGYIYQRKNQFKSDPSYFFISAPGVPKPFKIISNTFCEVSLSRWFQRTLDPSHISQTYLERKLKSRGNPWAKGWSSATLTAFAKTQINWLLLVCVFVSHTLLHFELTSSAICGSCCSFDRNPGLSLRFYSRAALEILMLPRIKVLVISVKFYLFPPMS